MEEKNISFELNTAFRDILYLDRNHTYFTSSGKKLESVTTFIGKLKEKFNSNFWSTYKAYEYSGYIVKSIYGEASFFFAKDSVESSFEKIQIIDNHSHLQVTPEMVKKQWSLDSDIGTSRGSYVHNYLENLERRIQDEPPILIPKDCTTVQAVNYIKSLSLAKDLCHEYLKYQQENLILIDLEFIVGSEKMGLAGRFDRLYWNIQEKEYQIWDFKTDKKLERSSKYNQKIKLFDIHECEYEKYSLQTSLYKKMILDQTNIKLGSSYIVWFDFKNNNFEVIKTKDYVDKLNEIFNENDITAYI